MALTAWALTPHPVPMADPDDPQKDKRAAREAKLAQALRNNLRRRKAPPKAPLATLPAPKDSSEP